uniref:Uncharacterized protein n=1 Tax=Caenorhabditis japonica TaxID=281687 RepID=A0A8R1I751_CAEJA
MVTKFEIVIYNNDKDYNKDDIFFKYRRYCGSRISTYADDWWCTVLSLTILKSIPGWNNYRGIFVDFSTSLSEAGLERTRTITDCAMDSQQGISQKVKKKSVTKTVNATVACIM